MCFCCVGWMAISAHSACSWTDVGVVLSKLPYYLFIFLASQSFEWSLVVIAAGVFVTLYVVVVFLHPGQLKMYCKCNAYILQILEYITQIVYVMAFGTLSDRPISHRIHNNGLSPSRMLLIDVSISCGFIDKNGELMLVAGPCRPISNKNHMPTINRRIIIHAAFKQQKSPFIYQQYIHLHDKNTSMRRIIIINYPEISS